MRSIATSAQEEPASSTRRPRHYAAQNDSILATMRELDLHDHTVDEALRVFVEFYNRHVRSGSREPLRIIHGYGSTEKGGKIRKKLRLFLESGAGSLEWKTGEDVEGNPGVTIVYPKKILQAREAQLAGDILE